MKKIFSVYALSIAVLAFAGCSDRSDKPGKSGEEQGLRQPDHPELFPVEPVPDPKPRATIPTVVLEADTHVAKSYPTTAYGSLAYVRTDNDPVLEGYVRFNVSGLSAPAKKATLRLRVTDGSSDGPAVYSTTNSWVESTLTWNTKPARGTTVVADIGAATAGTDVDYDVTSLVKANGQVSFALVNSSTSGFSFGSKESPTPPKLIVEPAPDPAPLPLPSSFTFTAAGDFGNNTDASNVMKLAPPNGEFLFMLGDLSYAPPPETTWCNFVKSTIGSHKVVIVSGNHESISTYNNGLIDNFIAANCLPNPLTNAKGVYGKEYYFDYPASAPLARFVVVSPDLPFENPTVTYTSSKGTAHYNWAVSTIDSARAAGIKWIIVATHRPCQTIGVKPCEMGKDFFNMLVEKKVDLVLTGHDHNYQRGKQLALGSSCPSITPDIYNSACVVDNGSDGIYDKGKGPVFMVIGTGGRSPYALNSSDPEAPYMASWMPTNTTLGLAKITVTQKNIDLAFLPSSGTYTDKFSIVEATAPIPSPDPTCVCPGPTPEPTPTPTPDPVTVQPPVISTTPAETFEDFLNPERGFYVGVNLMSATSTGTATARSSGHSTAIALIRLDLYRDKPLNDAFLAQLNAGFASARAAGIKVILRFMYNSAQTPDAPREIVMEHIRQVTPIVKANSDVIAVWQAGFIGGWGEWHGSTNGLDNPTDRANVIKGELAALPTNRMIQLRTPMFKDAFSPGGALTPEQAFTGTDKSRIGHHNDCFLSSVDDYGTFASPMTTWVNYYHQEGRFTAIGGETCNPYPARSDCTPAMAEMRAGHWDYLNEQYNTNILDVWKTQGCFPEAKKLLGYRFVLTRIAYSQAVKPGGVLEVELDILNRGFSAPFNPRPVYLVFTQGTTKSMVQLPTDPRKWESGTTTSLKYKIKVPYNITPGQYKMSLWMPDEAPLLKKDPRYAIRFANTYGWDSTTGETTLADVLPIDAATTGSVDTTAIDFSVVPTAPTAPSKPKLPPWWQ